MKYSIIQRIIINKILNGENNLAQFFKTEVKDEKIKNEKDYINYKQQHPYDDPNVPFDAFSIIENDENLDDMILKVSALLEKERKEESRSYYKILTEISKLEFRLEELEEILDKIEGKKEKNIDYTSKKAYENHLKEVRRNLLCEDIITDIDIKDVDITKIKEEIKDLKEKINLKNREKRRSNYRYFKKNFNSIDKDAIAVINYILEKEDIAGLIDKDVPYDYETIINKLFNKDGLVNKEFQKELESYKELNKNMESISNIDLLSVTLFLLDKNKIKSADIIDLVTYLNKYPNQQMFSDPNFLTKYNWLISLIKININKLQSKLRHDKIMREYRDEEYTKVLEDKINNLLYEKESAISKKNDIKGTIKKMRNIKFDFSKIKLVKKQIKESGIKEISPEAKEKIRLLKEIACIIENEDVTSDDIRLCQDVLWEEDITDPYVKKEVHKLLGKLKSKVLDYTKDINKYNKNIKNISDFNGLIKGYSDFSTYSETEMINEIKGYMYALNLLENILKDLTNTLNDSTKNIKNALSSIRTEQSRKSLEENFRITTSKIAASKSIIEADEFRQRALEAETINNGLKYYSKTNKSDIKDSYLVYSSEYATEKPTRGKVSYNVSINDELIDLKVYVINMAPFTTSDMELYLEQKYKESIEQAKKGIFKEYEYASFASNYEFEVNSVRPAIEYKITFDKNYNVCDFNINECDISIKQGDDKLCKDVRKIYKHKRNDEEAMDTCFERIINDEFIKYAQANELPIIYLGKNICDKKTDMQTDAIIEVLNSTAINLTKEDIRAIEKEWKDNYRKLHFTTKHVDNCEYRKIPLLNPFNYYNYNTQCVINTCVFGNTEMGKYKNLVKSQNKKVTTLNSVTGYISLEEFIKSVADVLTKQELENLNEKTI